MKTQSEIVQEMDAITQTIRIMKGKFGSRRITPAAAEEMRELEKRHSKLAVHLQKFQREELHNKGENQ